MSYAKQTATPPKTTRLSSEPVTVDTEKPVTLSSIVFVSDLSADEIREYRGTLTEPGRNDPNRDRSVEENLDLFERMRAGEFADGTKTLRAKIDMASSNINMRDPILYRVAHLHHQHQSKSSA